MKPRISVGLALATVAAAGILGAMLPDDNTATVLPAGDEASTVRSVQPATSASDIGAAPYIRPSADKSSSGDDELVRQARRTAQLQGIEEAD